MEQRVEHLEKAVSRHEDQIANLFSKVDNVNLHLTKIQNTLNQIRWMGTGAIVYYILTEVGLLAALKVVS